MTRKDDYLRKRKKEWDRVMAGDQWTPEERKILEDRKQPALVINRIKVRRDR